MRPRIVAFFLLLAGAAYAQWSDQAADNNAVADDNAVDEKVCAAAVDDEHSLLVAWVEDDGVNSTDVFADRIDPLCASLWDVGDQGVNVSNAPAVDSFDAAICADGSLGGYVVWTQGAGAARDIRAARVGPTGAFYDPEWGGQGGMVVATDTYGCFHPAVCFSDGQVYIAYKNDVYNPLGLLPALEVACYSPSGAPEWTAEVGSAGVNDRDGNPMDIRLWPDGQGGVIVVWERGPSGYEDASTFAIRIDAFGDGVWGQDPVELFRVPTTTSSHERAVAPDGLGGLYVAGPFEVQPPVPNEEEQPYGELIIFNHLNETGNWDWSVWDWGSQVDARIAGEWVNVYQEKPAIAPLYGGGCVVAWVDDRWPYGAKTHPFYGTNGLSIYAQRISSSGFPLWDEQVEYDELTDTQVLPGVIHRDYLTEGAPLTGGFDGLSFGRIHAATGAEDWPCFVWTDDRFGGTVEAGDNNDQLSGWDNITGVALGTNTDGGGRLHATITRENGTANVQLYKDAARAAGDLVGHTTSAGTGPQTIIEDNGSGLGGTITVDAVVVTDSDINCTYFSPGIYAEEPRLSDGFPRWDLDTTDNVIGNLTISIRDVSPGFVYAPDPRWGGYAAWTDDEDANGTNPGPDVYAAHFNYKADLGWMRVTAGLGPGPDIFPPPPVTGFQGVEEGDSIHLTWTNPPTGAAPLDDFWGVEIRRGTSSEPLTPNDGKWVFGGPGMPGAGASEYFDTDVVVGESYYYAAFSYDTAPSDVNFSTGTSCVPSPIRFGQDEVRNLNATPGDGSVTLEWKNPDNYDTIRVYSPDATGTLLYEGGGEAYTHSGLDNGTEYTYTVYAVLAGSPSDGVSISCVPLPPVSAFTVQEADRANILSWTNPPAAGWFGGVRVQCNLLTYPQDENDGEKVYEDAGQSFTHTQYAGGPLQNGTTYYYTAFVFDNAATTHYSAGVTGSGTPGDRTAPAEVSNLTVIEGNGTVTLQWDNPTDLDFAGVRITRSGQTEPIFSGMTEIYYDEGLTNEVEYTYTIYTYDDKTPPNESGGTQVRATPSASAPPQFRTLPSVQNIQKYTAEIRWSTNVPITGWVYYGTTEAVGSVSEPVSEATTTNAPYVYVAELSGLSAGATYYYKVYIEDANGNSAENDPPAYPFTTRTDFASEDTDGDLIPDDWELEYFDTIADCIAIGADSDPDQDGLENLDEYRHGTDPHNPDTDGDLKPDGEEVRDQTNPLAPDAELPMRTDAGGCGATAALVAILAMAALRRRRD